MKIAIALFAYSGVEPVTHQCMVRDLLSLKGGGHRYYCHYSDADLSRCRGTATKLFFETDCDVLVMVDHDLEWDAGTLEYIAAKAHDMQAVVGPAVPKRAFCQGLASSVLEEFPVGWVGEEHTVPARWIAGAMMAIPRAALEAVAGLPEVQTVNGAMPFCQMKDPGTGHYLTEDWAFCSRAARFGFKCAIVTKPVIVHHGRMGFTMKTSVEKIAITADSVEPEKKS